MGERRHSNVRDGSRPRTRQVKNLSARLHVRVEEDPGGRGPPGPIHRRFASGGNPDLFRHRALRGASLLLIFFFGSSGIFFIFVLFGVLRLNFVRVFTLIQNHMRRCPRARPSGARHASRSGDRFPTPDFYRRKGESEDSRDPGEDANVRSQDHVDAIFL